MRTNPGLSPKPGRRSPETTQRFCSWLLTNTIGSHLSTIALQSRALSILRAGMLVAICASVSLNCSAMSFLGK
eukprot:13979584-Alexandrium_andersonii.AAC.1